MKQIAISIAVSAIILAGCSTTPSSEQEAVVDDLQERDYVAILVPEFSGNEQRGAFATGVGTGLGTEKVIPDLPDELASPARSALRDRIDGEVGEWFDDVAAFAEDTFEFDTIVLATARPTEQVTRVIGIEVNRRDVMEVTAAAIDVSTLSPVAESVEYVSFNEDAELTSLTNAGRNGMTAMLEAPVEE